MASELSTVGGDQSLEELRRELAEAREQQAATAGILVAISNSPTDPSRVFAEIATSAARLCDAHDSTITQLTGDGLHLLARHGSLPTGRLPFTRGSVIARTIIDKKTIHVADLPAETDEYPEGSELARRYGYRSILVVPLMRVGEAIGAIAIRRAEVCPFTDRQIELLKIFANQAVIAIENTRLFEEVQARNAELRTALDQQTATSEILGVIGSSPTDAQPVFDTIVKNAKRLLNGYSAGVTTVAGEKIHLAAFTKTGETGDDILKDLAPRDLASAPLLAIMVRDLVPRIGSDTETDQRIAPSTRETARVRGYRSILGVPMVRRGRVIGSLTVTRRDPGTFADEEVALIKTFADQAVIAVENTRLFRG